MLHQPQSSSPSVTPSGGEGRGVLFHQLQEEPVVLWEDDFCGAGPASGEPPRSEGIPEGYDLNGASFGKEWLLKLERLWAFHPRRAVRPFPHASHPETTGKTKSPRRRPTTMAYDTVFSLRKLRKRLSTKILCQTGTSLAELYVISNNQILL